MLTLFTIPAFKLDDIRSKVKFALSKSEVFVSCSSDVKEQVLDHLVENGFNCESADHGINVKR